MLDTVKAAFAGDGLVPLIGNEAFQAAGHIGTGVVLELESPAARAWNGLNPVRTDSLQVTCVAKATEGCIALRDQVDAIMQNLVGADPIIRTQRISQSFGDLSYQTDEDVRENLLRAAVLVYEVRWVADV